MRQTRGRGFIIGAVLLMAGAGAALAQGVLKPEGRAEVLQKLTDCRKIAEPDKRLACYDQAAATLDQAEAKGDIVVVDRNQARQVRRQAFGFHLPSISLFERGEKPEEVDTITSTVASARQNGAGKWVIQLEGGAVWVQIDADELFTDPKPGMPVRIKRASMGSYLMIIGNNRGMRVHRTE